MKKQNIHIDDLEFEQLISHEIHGPALIRLAGLQLSTPLCGLNPSFRAFPAQI